MTWLITGGCGFVGCNLADALLTQGEDVVLVDNLSRTGSDQNLRWLRETHGPEWRFVLDDVRDADAVKAVVSEHRPSAIAHLAGQVAATTSMQNPRFDFDVNAGGTLNVLEAVRCCSPNSVVLYSSTNKVYGSLEYVRWQEGDTRYTAPDYPAGFDEKLLLDGSTPYGCSKLAAESYVRDYFRIYGIRTVVFRHSSMYGGRQFSTFDQGWVGWFCGRALEIASGETEPVAIAGDGKQVRDLLYAEDLIRCYFSAFREIDKCQGHAFNIGAGMSNSLSLLELFAELERLANVRIAVRQTPWRIADQKVFVADHAKATRLMGWVPEVSYSQGLEHMLEWCRAIRSGSDSDGS